MELTIGEKIMVIRNRKGLKLNELAAKLYPDLAAAHQKLKKIEAGIQTPEESEIKTIAKTLNIDSSYFFDNEVKDPDALCLKPDFLSIFPGIDRHFNLLNTGFYMGKDFCLDVFRRMVKDLEEN